MMAREVNYSDASLSDFSSTLLSVNEKNKRDVEEEVVVNISSKNYDADKNRNLSDVLSQIQDDGPAHSQGKSREKLFSRKTQMHAADVDESVTKQAEKVDSYQFTNAEKFSVSAKQGCQTKVNNGSTWFQLILILSVTALAILVLLNINLRASDLEEALNIYGADLNEGGMVQSKDLLPEIIKINESLKSVKHDLKNIKTAYPGFAAEPEEIITAATPINIDEVVLLKDNVNLLENEIIALKEKLQAANAKLPGVDNVVVLNKKEADSKVVNTNLVVNLASLSSVSRAEELVKKLHAAGLSPSIEGVIINNASIYRVSVSGFIDTVAAKLFIQNAGKKYGMKDGWIRKS